LHNIISIIFILISSIYPIQGGGDYRGIYDIGLKRAFMGYIGLLLNAPYKIDSMMWMRLMWIGFLLFVLYLFVLNMGAIITRWAKWGKRPKMG
jgi:hypothetical protein